MCRLRVGVVTEVLLLLLRVRNVFSPVNIKFSLSDETVFRYQGLTMNTFGKGGEAGPGGYTRSGDFLIIGK